MKNNRIYIVSFFIGILILLFSFIPIVSFIKSAIFIDIFTSDSINNISISLGAGFITSAIIAYLIDKSNLKMKTVHENNLKRVFLIEILEYIKHYNKFDFQFEKLDFILMHDFIIKIISTYERYIPLGVSVFTSDEFQKVDYFYSNTLTLAETIDRLHFKEIYTKYEDVISQSILLKFEDGPYSEENTILKISKALDKQMKKETARSIGEFIYIYYLFDKLIDDFNNKFEYLLY